MRRVLALAGVAFLLICPGASADVELGQVANSHAFGSTFGVNCSSNQIPGAGNCEESEVRQPAAVVATGGRYYVLDYSAFVQDPRNRIAVFAGDGTFLGAFGSPGPGLGSLDDSYDLVLGKDSRLYAAESGNTRIQSFAADLAAPSPSILTTLPWSPDAIDSGPDGELALTSSLGEIVKLDTSGVPVFEEGVPGGLFPQDVAVAPDGDVWFAVGDPDNRIHHLSPSGQHLGSFGVPGEAEGQLHQPESLDIDSRGFLYITEWDVNHGWRISRFTPDGKFTGVLPTPALAGYSVKRVAVDANDNVLAVVNSFPSDYSVIRYTSRYVRLAKKPKPRTRARKATFVFSSQLESPSYRCRLDKRKWSNCSKQKTWRRLSPGRHTATVAVRESASSPWGPPTVFRWRVRR